MSAKKIYITNQPVALGDVYHSDNVRVELTDKQAEFLLASGAIRPEDAPAATQAPAATAAKASGKATTKGDAA